MNSRSTSIRVDGFGRVRTGPQKLVTLVNPIPTSTCIAPGRVGRVLTSLRAGEKRTATCTCKQEPLHNPSNPSTARLARVSTTWMGTCVGALRGRVHQNLSQPVPEPVQGAIAQPDQARDRRGIRQHAHGSPAVPVRELKGAA